MVLFCESTPLICHCAIVVPRLILRSGNEGKAKTERRMNEQRSKEYRTPIEESACQQSRRTVFDPSSTKVQNNHEICKQKHYYFTHLLAFALSCLKLRRNNIVPSQKGVGVVGVNFIGGKKKFKNRNAILHPYFHIFSYLL